MKQQLHKLLDLVLEAKERGIDLSLDIRPDCVIGVYDCKTFIQNENGYSYNTGLYEKKYTSDFNNIQALIDKTEEYIKNYEHRTIEAK